MSEIKQHWHDLWPDAVQITAVDLYGNYERNGAAVAWLPDGKFGSAEYSHCSCYGPEDTMHNNGLFDTLGSARGLLGQTDLEDLDSQGKTWTK